MKREVMIAACFVAAGMTIASSQTGDRQGPHSQISGYSADSSEKLTPIVGSPFAGNVQWMAVNGAWMFGVDNGTNIDSFSIASNGALQQISTINATQWSRDTRTEPKLCCRGRGV